METILYATDYSESSVPALRWALELADIFDAKLKVMHVFDIPISIASPVSMSYIKKEKRLFEENRVKLKKFCKEHLGTDFEKSDIDLVVDEDGSITDGILEKAHEFDADLLVLGTKEASIVKEFLLGSTTKAILKKTSCPLLVVPHNTILKNIEKIIYATDFESADIFAIRKLVKLAQKLDAEIRIVHITTRKEYAGEMQMEWFKEMLSERVNYQRLEFDLIFSEEVFEELVGYLADSEADLLAMLERKDQGFYQKYLQSDLVKKMMKSTKIPLLSFSVGGL